MKLPRWLMSVLLLCICTVGHQQLQRLQTRQGQGMTVRELDLERQADVLQRLEQEISQLERRTQHPTR